jgi:hypothetical protein
MVVLEVVGLEIVLVEFLEVLAHLVKVMLAVLDSLAVRMVAVAVVALLQ